MSCTVVAVPYAIAWVVGAIATAAVGSAVTNNENDLGLDFLDIAQNDADNCSDDYVITEKHFVEKTFETPFTDKEILLKTLQEHGVKNISEWENGIVGDVDNYRLTFEKPSNETPYTVKITCTENDCAEEKANDLNNEYALNVQEDAYLHIIDKLKENNMQIEEEEVTEDNTIVLTVNID